jgi:hypothetical protein
VLNLDLPIVDWADEEGIAEDDVMERLKRAADEAYASRVARSAPDVMRQVERAVLLQTLGRAVARASGNARQSALGGRFPRLRPARSAAGIPHRGLPTVRGAAGKRRPFAL